MGANFCCSSDPCFAWLQGYDAQKRAAAVTKVAATAMPMSAPPSAYFALLRASFAFSAAFFDFSLNLVNSLPPAAFAFSYLAFSLSDMVARNSLVCIKASAPLVNKNTKMTKEEAEIAKGGDEGQGDRLRNAKIK